MSNKLISLPQLQEFKTSSDAKYQDKLTAGNNISIVNDTLSVTTPTYFAVKSSGSNSISNNTIVNIGQVVLLPGKYLVIYTCLFELETTGYCQCGFSTSTTDITGFGRAWGDNRNYWGDTQTRVAGVIEVSASSYPNGQTFYMLAKQTSGSTVTAYPRCYYIKFE